MTNYNEEEKIIDKIKRITSHIDRYSHPKVTNVLGRHLHALVKKRVKGSRFQNSG